MFELYYWPTPNGNKIVIFLEETGLSYQIKPVNIGKGEQFEPDYLKLNPNNKMPTIIDKEPGDGKDPIVIFESGAILLYLADKTKKFIPQDIRGRFQVIQWLFWQMAGLGPMSGQNGHFLNYANEKVVYAMERYKKEVNRLYAVMDHQLSHYEYLAGNYSIADMACYPWIVPFENQQQDLNDFPNLKRWFLTVGDRPAVSRAYAFAKEINPNPNLSDEAKKILFGQDANTFRSHFR